MTVLDQVREVLAWQGLEREPLIEIEPNYWAVGASHTVYWCTIRRVALIREID